MKLTYSGIYFFLLFAMSPSFQIKTLFINKETMKKITIVILTLTVFMC